MSRLIDADKLIKELHEALDGSGYDEDYKDMGIDDFIMSQPTAYDVEKVVAEFEKMRNEDSQGCKDVVGRKCFSYIDCGLCIMDRAIDIVERGGVE